MVEVGEKATVKEGKGEKESRTERKNVNMTEKIKQTTITEEA